MNMQHIFDFDFFVFNILDIILSTLVNHIMLPMPSAFK